LKLICAIPNIELFFCTSIDNVTLDCDAVARIRRKHNVYNNSKE